MMNNYQLEKFIKEISEQTDENEFMITLQKKITIFYNQFRIGESNVWFYNHGILINAIDRYVFENERYEVN